MAALAVMATLILNLQGCSKADTPAAAPAVAGPAASVPAAAAASTATTVQAAPAVPLVVPAEDRMEPVSIENARLPGGGKMPPDPVEERKGAN